MTRLADCASILRSKNAGVALFTIDALFPDHETWEAAVKALTLERVAGAYGISPDEVVALIPFEEGLAIKVTLARARLAGGDGLGETDLFGGGQSVPLGDLEI